MLCRWLRVGPGGGGQSGLGVVFPLSVCLCSVPVPKQSPAPGHSPELSARGAGRGDPGRRRPPAGRPALLGPPELLALGALHTLQPHPALWQEDLSMSNPLSGSQILRPGGVLPFLRNPFPAQGKHGSLVVWAQHWEPWAGQPASEPRITSSAGVQGLGSAHSPLEVRLNLFNRCPLGCQSDLCADAERRGWGLGRLRAPSSLLLLATILPGAQEEGKGSHCCVTSGRPFCLWASTAFEMV